MALQTTSGIGCARIKSLLDHFDSLEAIVDSAHDVVGSIMGGYPDFLDRLSEPLINNSVEQVDAWLQCSTNHHVITYYDPRYPRLLREISDPPVLLYVRGSVDCLTEPQFAIVGSRNPTPVGRDNARDFARTLAGASLTISSGLALGVDAAAHLGALEFNRKTIAVSGTGIDNVYPAKHVELARAITARGAIISEFPLGTPPLKQNFPRRNRLISGMALGVLVVEAALRSGSLITARLATEQGREVFAIPGSIHSPQSRGCHRLIRQGAKLVETAEDIVEELAPLAQFVLEPKKLDSAKQEKLTPSERRLLAQMGYDPVSIDFLVESCGLTTERISSMLLQMELQGWVEPVSGGRYLRRVN
ncbi:MAG: DNA-processing protein DprA [Gammaproteobacteria bacterium]|nr:DNA-processing protein DprA [Gammaproteobacteria bacterium]